jgi:hypothetical protein
MASQPAVGGTGPLYEHTEAGKRAAEEDVAIPDSEGSEDADTAEADEKQQHPTGKGQAAINRDVDPPA